jgi:hypothetical protein
MPAIPETTVQKMIGVTTMVMRRMNASPSGFMATARAGLRYPNAMAITTAMQT